MLKTATATVENPLITLQDWGKIVGTKRAFGDKTASAVNKIASGLLDGKTTYLLTHSTIMSSVMVEGEPFDHLIKPECSHLVNSNEDAWTNEVIHQSYRSFVGAFNFLEHYQNTKAAKGHILDAVLRKILIAPPDVWVYFVDILVATDMAHTELVDNIRSGKTRYMSMGCSTDVAICSYCGQRVTNDAEYCQHLSFQKGLFIPDDDGIPRRVSELCGHKSLPNGGVHFIEASWVGTPAFAGAEMRGVVCDGWVGPHTKFTVKSAAGQQGFRKAAAKSAQPEMDFALRARLNSLFR